VDEQVLYVGGFFGFPAYAPDCASLVSCSFLALKTEHNYLLVLSLGKLCICEKLD